MGINSTVIYGYANTGTRLPISLIFYAGDLIHPEEMLCYFSESRIESNCFF
jgi:hypothetical protein